MMLNKLIKIVTNNKMQINFLFAFSFLIIISSRAFAQDYKLVWSDEFNGTQLDTSNWEYQIGNHRGWGNNEKEYYLPGNVSVKNGYLIITAKKEDYKGFHYTSGRINTKNNCKWKYGKIEMRAKLPVGQGMWPAFWMMPAKPVYGSWPRSGEIDIMENLGNDSTTIHGTLHYGNVPPNNKFTGEPYKLTEGDFNNSFHTFTLIWEKNKIQWLVDGHVYQTLTKWYTVGGDYPAPFNQPFNIILNLAVGGYWPGYPDSTTVFPQKYVIDYVRVYQKIAKSTNDKDK